ncbi:hypothetical protein N9D31_04000, partial [Oligoflexaceae bacterium]|nr:hypothetical protein [Oligoflexaceae bacterium]
NTKDPFNPSKLLFPEYPEGYLCHVDASNYYSGCDYFPGEGAQKKPGHFHFFRVNHSSDKDVQDAVAMIQRIKGKLKYDIDMNLDVLETENRDKVRQAIFNGKIGDFKQYCSEVPYTIHTLAAKRSIMTPLDMTTMMYGFNSLFRSGKFVNALDPYKLSEELAFALARGYKLLGLEISSAKLKIVQESTKAYLLDSKISTLKKYVSGWYAGVKMPPLGYMHHAKRSSNVHYVGSIEDRKYPPKPIYKAEE